MLQFLTRRKKSLKILDFSKSAHDSEGISWKSSTWRLTRRTTRERCWIDAEKVKWNANISHGSEKSIGLICGLVRFISSRLTLKTRRVFVQVKTEGDDMKDPCYHQRRGHLLLFLLVKHSSSDWVHVLCVVPWPQPSFSAEVFGTGFTMALPRKHPVKKAAFSQRSTTHSGYLHHRVNLLPICEQCHFAISANRRRRALISAELVLELALLKNAV